MKELVRIIEQHLLRYPALEIQDLVKLIYQQEFGGGHMIADPQRSLQRLRQELLQIESEEAARDGSAALLYHPPQRLEPIGNGIVRLHLNIQDQALPDAEAINRLFVQSAAEISGSVEGFERKLQVLAPQNFALFPFSAAAIADYLHSYQQQGYPAVSHSEGYRRRYRPHYRIIRARYVEAP